MVRFDGIEDGKQRLHDQAWQDKQCGRCPARFAQQQDEHRGKDQELEQRHDPYSRQIERPGARPAVPLHEQGGHAPQPPQDRVTPVHGAAVRRVVHEGVADAPVAGVHQVARVHEPGVRIVIEEEPGRGQARLGVDDPRIEVARAAVRMDSQHGDQQGQQEQAGGTGNPGGATRTGRGRRHQNASR